jgi:DHA2 family methylenomycin A resistance protein-like MFS transporter
MTTTQPETTTGQSDPGRSARRWTLVAMSLGFAVVQLDISVVNVAIKSIGSALGGGVSDLQWVVNAYTIGFAAFILTAGALGDRIGARRVFISGFFLFMVASAVCGLAPNLGVLIAARAIQGIGAAVLVPSSLTLLNHAYTEPAARSHAVGLWLAGASTALSGGPLIGGILIATLGWRAIFFINVPVALAGIYLTRRYAAETSQSRDRGVDVPGQVLAVLTLTALVAATIEGGSRGFGSPLVLAGFALAAAAGASFVAVEARGARPMLPLRLFENRTFSVTAAMGLLINIAFYGLIFVFSLLFQREQGLTPLETGLALAPIMIAITIANLLAGRIDQRFGPRRTVAVAIVVVAVACAALLGVGASTGYGAMVVQLAALGAAAGSIIPVITSELLGSVDRTRSGVAAGTLNTLRQTGSAIGVALFGSLLARRGGFTAGVHTSLAITVGLCVAIGALTPLLRDRAG